MLKSVETLERYVIEYIQYIVLQCVLQVSCLLQRIVALVFGDVGFNHLHNP